MRGRTIKSWFVTVAATVAVATVAFALATFVLGARSPLGANVGS